MYFRLDQDKLSINESWNVSTKKNIWDESIHMHRYIYLYAMSKPENYVNDNYLRVSLCSLGHFGRSNIVFFLCYVWNGTITLCHCKCILGTTIRSGIASVGQFVWAIFAFKWTPASQSVLEIPLTIVHHSQPLSFLFRIVLLYGEHKNDDDNNGKNS